MSWYVDPRYVLYRKCIGLFGLSIVSLQNQAAKCWWNMLYKSLLRTHHHYPPIYHVTFHSAVVVILQFVLPARYFSCPFHARQLLSYITDRMRHFISVLSVCVRVPEIIFHWSTGWIGAKLDISNSEPYYYSADEIINFPYVLWYFVHKPDHVISVSLTWFNRD